MTDDTKCLNCGTGPYCGHGECPNMPAAWNYGEAPQEPPVELDKRIFCGIYPEGIIYSDRTRAELGDYKRLAFLAFRTLRLHVERDCPEDLRAQIERDAATVQGRRGEKYQISASGQTVILGWGL